MPPVWRKPLGDLAQLYQSINHVELDDDFYSRSNSEIIKALTHASLALKRMSAQEFNSCDDAFFLSTRNGLILIVQRLTNYVKNVLHAFVKGVHDSDEDRLRKAGFASFTTSRDSTKLNLTQRVSSTKDYPVKIYNRQDVRFVPVLLTNNACSFCEGYLIDLLWNRDNLRPRGEFPVGTNKKGVNSIYGDVDLTFMHPGCLYVHSVNAGIGLREHDRLLKAHKKAGEANKENQPPAIKTRPIETFFSTSKIPSRENSTPTPTKEQVEENLQVELFPEMVEILFESETREDLNSFISFTVSDDTYAKLRQRRYSQTARANARKRAAGEDVPLCRAGAPVKLAAHQRANNGARSCMTENCTQHIVFRMKDGSGEGWCCRCAPDDKKSSKWCDHPGCEKDKKFDGKCSTHADKTSKKYIEDTKKAAEKRKANRRKAKK